MQVCIFLQEELETFGIDWDEYLNDDYASTINIYPRWIVPLPAGTIKFLLTLMLQVMPME